MTSSLLLKADKKVQKKPDKTFYSAITIRKQLAGSMPTSNMPTSHATFLTK
jgi:hypothetical protein